MPDPAISELDRLRDAVTDRLAGLNDFTGANVLSRKTGDLGNQIERGLAELGVFVLVMIPQAAVKPRQSQRPVLDPVKVRVRCCEDKLLYRSGKSAAYLAERAVAALQYWQPSANDVPGGSHLIPVDPGILELNIIGKPGEESGEDLAGFDVFFETKLALTPAT